MMEKIIEGIFRKKISSERIQRHIETLPSFPHPGIENPDEVQISVVQRRIRLVGTIEEYIDMLFSFIQKAAAQHSHLVVFPEYNFFDLFGLIPGFSLLNALLNRKAQRHGGRKDAPQEESGDVSSLAPLFQAIAPSVEKGVATIFPLLARKTGMTIYTGSYLFLDEEGLYNAGSLYGPQGQLIGTQAKLHLTDFEQQLGLIRRNQLTLFKSDIGRMALPICMDATYFETFYQARESGGDLIILPIANMEEFHEWRALRGIWPRVQESYTYGAKASLNGWIAGMHFTGKAGIFAPLALTPKRDGVCALASHFEGDEVITATVNYRKLRQERATAQYHGDRNMDFEKNYFYNTYCNGGNEDEKK